MTSIPEPVSKGVRIDSFTKRIQTLRSRFTRINLQEQDPEIQAIQNEAEVVLQEVKNLPAEFCRKHGGDLRQVIKSAFQLYLGADVFPDLVKTARRVHEELASIHEGIRSLNPNPSATKRREDQEAKVAFSKRLEHLEEITENMMDSPAIALSSPIAQEIMRARNAISAGRKALAQITAAQRSQAYEESKKTIPGGQLEVEAFLQGIEKNVIKWLEAGSGIVTRDVVSGPRAKTTETQYCEDILGSIITDPNSVTISEKEEEETKEVGGKKVKEKVTNYYVKFQATIRRWEWDEKTNTNKEIIVEKKQMECKLNDLMSKANFSQIRLTPEQLEAYARGKDRFTFQPSLDDQQLKDRVNSPDLDPPLSKTEKDTLLDLRPSERLAIHMYTMEGPYIMVNFLLRNRPDLMFAQLQERTGTDTSTAEQRTALLKESLLQAGAVSSALTSLPNYEGSVDTAGKKRQYLYRADVNLPQQIVEQRIRLARDGGISCEAGFLSTSHTTPAENLVLSNPTTLTIIRNAYGKHVSPLSVFGENEVLLPPTQIQWKGAQEAKAPWGKVVVFWGDPVNQPDEAQQPKPRYITPEETSEEF
jgi:hypothetical protein